MPVKHNKLTRQCVLCYLTPSSCKVWVLSTMIVLVVVCNWQVSTEIGRLSTNGQLQHFQALATEYACIFFLLMGFIWINKNYSTHSGNNMGKVFHNIVSVSYIFIKLNDIPVKITHYGSCRPKDTTMKRTIVKAELFNLFETLYDHLSYLM